MGTLKAGALVLVLVALASCGGEGSSPPQLVDGTIARETPAELDGLDDAVLTRTAARRESDLDPGEVRACGVPGDGGDRTVVERVGLHGSSLTIKSGSSLYGCDKIAYPLTAVDPDLPWGGVWCGGSVGRLEDGALSDPRLGLCPNTANEITAFVWVDPQPGARWVVVTDAGTREAYEVVATLPVRVTTTDDVRPEGSASFDVTEYDSGGTELRSYTLEAVVSG